jgi:hypothetical protein
MNELSTQRADKRATGQGGVVALLRAECAWPALPEHERWAHAAPYGACQT